MGEFIKKYALTHAMFYEWATLTTNLVIHSFDEWATYD